MKECINLSLKERYCGYCNHWYLDANDSMFCMYYGLPCDGVEYCPVRTLDVCIAQRRMLWMLLRFVKENRSVLRDADKLLTPKK